MKPGYYINPQLTPNFNINEFRCNDNTGVPYDLVNNVKELAENLQVLRDYIKEPLRLNSGYRNPTYNEKIGGEDNSYHTKAMAADITSKSFAPKALHTIIETLIKQGKMKQGGLGLYPGFVHYDVRGFKARW